jgi:Ca-activated chloride channel family protein
MAAPYSCRGSKRNSITLCVALLLAGSVQLAAQFTSSTTAVEVYVSVTDASGAAVRALTQEDFEVLEDGVPQQISAFAAGAFPLRVAVAIDHSFSMAGDPLRNSKRATRVFLDVLRPADESVVLGIGSRVSIVLPHSATREQQAAAVDALSAWGTTPLHDAVIEAINATDVPGGRRAVVILSDGDDRYSETLPSVVVDRARRGNVLVYPVAIGRSSPQLFSDLAAVSGGRTFHVRDPRRLDETLRTIASDLHQQYMLGYSPKRPFVPAARDEWRRITVKVKRTGVTVRARDGYYVR